MIQQISIKNFITYEHFVVKESGLSNINIIIGENDTGKTGLLKLLYGATRSIEELALRKDISFKKILSDKMLNVFQPKKASLGELVSKGSSEKLSVS